MCNGLNSANNWSYSYDHSNRIYQASAPAAGYSDQYCYDSHCGTAVGDWNNLLTAAPYITNTTGFGLNVGVLANNQLTGGYYYDAAGNMTQDIANSGLQYDAENRLTVAQGFQYAYDGRGNRVQKAAADGSSNVLYWTDEGSEQLSISDGSGTIQRDYIYFNGERVAAVNADDDTPIYYLRDNLGSTRAIVNWDGSSILWQADYWPFGQQILNTANIDNDDGFTGYQWDGETGYYYAKARYYSPTIGRFTSPDPLSGDIVNPPTWNRYSYVTNNPTSLTDPSGADGDGTGQDLALGLWPYEEFFDLAFFDNGNPDTPVPEPNWDGALQGESFGIPNALVGQWIGQANLNNLLGTLLPVDEACDFGPCLPGVYGFDSSIGAGGTPDFSPLTFYANVFLHNSAFDGGPSITDCIYNGLTSAALSFFGVDSVVQITPTGSFHVGLNPGNITGLLLSKSPQIAFFAGATISVSTRFATKVASDFTVIAGALNGAIAARSGWKTYKSCLDHY